MKAVCSKDKHEKFIECGAKPCNSQTCADPELSPICTEDCKLNGDCICEDGYYRDECEKKCVPSLSECSPGSKKSPFKYANC